MTPLLWLSGDSVPVADIPLVDIGSFRKAVVQAVFDGGRIAALFGDKAGDSTTCLYAVLADDSGGRVGVIAGNTGSSYLALTPDCPQAHLFEREIYEKTGVKPEGHPWLKPVRKGHATNKEAPHDDPPYPFFAMSGQSVHEVAVGPVHAGVIEPGHFRFQCHGEVVHHLEIQLGYQHRGVEAALVGGPNQGIMAQMEVVAGDTTTGHAMAYCLNLEAMAGVEVPPRGQSLRAIALELERLANHVGDIGALANDVGYLPAASYCGRLRGDFLNMTAAVCGSRFSRGLVRPGGCAFDVDDGIVNDLLKRVAAAERDVKGAMDLFFDTESVRGRLDGTGILPERVCRDMGIVGMAARASGIRIDSRASHARGWYRRSPIEVATWKTGDVLARAMLRRIEVERSTSWVRDQLTGLPSGPVRIPCGRPRAAHLAVAMVEGWRGEIAHVAVTGDDCRFTKYKIVDPSFHNWYGLAYCLRGQEISDFPLCNKSFNLSYCGFDL